MIRTSAFFTVFAAIVSLSTVACSSAPDGGEESASTDEEALRNTGRGPLRFGCTESMCSCKYGETGNTCEGMATYCAQRGGTGVIICKDGVCTCGWPAPAPPPRSSMAAP